jgi:hypothetical protein
MECWRLSVVNYLIFSLGFIFFHILSYTIAGALALKFSKDVYEEQNRLVDFLRDMSDEEEKKYVAKWFLPAQILRGFLMSVVLYPVLGVLNGIGFLPGFLFVAGLMLVFSDLASASPFTHNIEGFVYLKPVYLRKKAILKLYSETVIYSVMFGLLVSWFLF